VAAMSRTFQISCGHADLHATQPHQAEIGESLGISQPTISRAISVITPLIPESISEFVPTADDLDPDAQYILDGTLLPCWSWDGRKELYSGKHKTTGMSVQVACTIYGKLASMSQVHRTSLAFRS
jgi:hypothetical protein